MSIEIVFWFYMFVINCHLVSLILILTTYLKIHSTLKMIHCVSHIHSIYICSSAIFSCTSTEKVSNLISNLLPPSLRNHYSLEIPAYRENNTTFSVFYTNFFNFLYFPILSYHTPIGSLKFDSLWEYNHHYYPKWVVKAD